LIGGIHTKNYEGIHAIKENIRADSNQRSMAHIYSLFPTVKMWHKNTIKYIFSRKANNPTNSEGKMTYLPAQEKACLI
jgi:hypothetical protein